MGTGRSSAVRILTLVLALTAAVAVSTVASADTGARVFAARLNGAHEVPPVQTPAHGTAVFELSRDGQSMSFFLIADDIINVVAAHIHIGAANESGRPVVVPLFPGNRSRVVGDAFILSGRFTAADFVGPLAGHPMADLVTELRANHAYTNVHTQAHPGGEIRGQTGPVGE